MNLFSSSDKDSRTNGAPNIAVDATPEKVFDDLTWLAAQICCAPMALVSVAGAHGQRLKSKVGLTTQDASRELTICKDTLVHRRIHIVQDALLDKDLAHDPLVIGGPKLRFLAGVPLLTVDGDPIGTLLVMDRVPRQLSPAQIYAMEVLARQLVSQLEWRKETERNQR